MRRYIVLIILIVFVAGWIANGSLTGFIDSICDAIYNFGIKLICMLAPILLIGWIIWKIIKG